LFYIDRAADNSLSIDLALAFTGGGCFDYMGLFALNAHKRSNSDFDSLFSPNPFSLAVRSPGSISPVRVSMFSFFCAIGSR
jgi:hypothetical protein